MSEVSKSKDQRMMAQADQLADMQQKQLSGQIGKVKANIDSSFEISEHEAEGYVHVFTRVKHVQPDKKEIMNEDRVIKVHANIFDQKVKDGMLAVYDEFRIVHDPRKEGYKSEKIVTTLTESQTIELKESIDGLQKSKVEALVKVSELEDENESLKSQLEALKAANSVPVKASDLDETKSPEADTILTTNPPQDGKPVAPKKGKAQ